jgi:hypothetical protein
MKIPKRVVESKAEKILIDENKKLKFTILKMLHHIQLFENSEIEREKHINVNFYNSEMLFSDSL